MLELPPVVVAYFDAAPDAGVETLREIFAPDAHVRDEAHDHAGIEEIRRWRVDTYARTPFVSRPVDVRYDGDLVIVSAEVSGTFPNSPILLDHAFALSGGRIASLDIH